MAAAPHEFSSRRDEMFMARDGPKIFSPLGSGPLPRGDVASIAPRYNIPLLRSGL